MPSAAEGVPVAPPVRQRLIAAAVEALLDLGPADLISAIGTREIARRAGVSSTTLFHQFGSVADFAEAVVGDVYDPGTLPVGSIQTAVEEVRAAGRPVEAGFTLHRSEFVRLTTDPRLRLRMGLWAFGRGQADLAYRGFLRNTDARIAEFIDALIESWGREFRPPMNTQSYVASQVALLNGMSIRHLVDPEVSTAEIHALIGSVITATTLRVEGDRHDLPDRLAEINYYPLRNSRTGARITERSARTRAALMVAASELFVAQGYDETMLAQIARKAGTSTSTIYTHFGSKAGLASALMRKQADDLVGSRHTPDGHAADQLHTWLIEVAEFVGRRTEQAPAYLSSLMTQKPVRADDALIDATAQHLGAARRHGVPVPDRADDDLAQALLGLLIGQVLSRPADGSRSHVVSVTTLLLGADFADTEDLRDPW